MVGNHGVVYGSPCGRPEKVCLFVYSSLISSKNPGGGGGGTRCVRQYGGVPL